MAKKIQKAPNTLKISGAMKKHAAAQGSKAPAGAKVPLKTVVGNPFRKPF